MLHFTHFTKKHGYYFEHNCISILFAPKRKVRTSRCESACLRTASVSHSLHQYINSSVAGQKKKNHEHIVTQNNNKRDRGENTKQMEKQLENWRITT